MASREVSPRSDADKADDWPQGVPSDVLVGSGLPIGDDLRGLLEVIPVGLAVTATPDGREVLINPALASLLGLGASATALSLTPPNTTPADPSHRTGAGGHDGRGGSSVQSGANGGGDARPFRFLLDGREMAAADFPACRAVATGRPVGQQELTVVRADGRSLRLLSFAAPLASDGSGRRGAVGTFVDITDRKASEEAVRRAKESAEQARSVAEAARRQAEQARQHSEASGRAKDRFIIAMLSHELRTPLTPVLVTVSGLLDGDGASSLPRDVIDALAMVRRNIELEARLIDDLLDVTKISRGKLKLERAPSDLHALIWDVVGMLDAENDHSRPPVTLDLSAQRATVLGDPARLQQVLWNLLHNARKFTPASGEVSLRTETYDDGGDTWLRVTVRDTGVGIAPDTLPRIFLAFEQGSGDESRPVNETPGGLGLGLTISKTLVDLHKGRLRVRSDGVGHGATFTVELPLMTRDAAPAPLRDGRATVGRRVPGGQIPGGQIPRGTWDGVASGTPDESFPPRPPEGTGQGLPRLLLVDDHADTNRAMKRLLVRSGYDVTVAETVAEALAADADATHAGKPFDVLVSDIGLPDGTGLELLRSLNARRPDGRRMPAIALSGFGMEDDLRRSTDAGFAEHLTKPVSLGKLQEAIRAITPKMDGNRT